MYPYVLERIGEMFQMRLDVCARLPADHPFQHPMIDESVVAKSTNHEESSSSHPEPTTQTSETSILEDLVTH